MYSQTVGPSDDPVNFSPIGPASFAVHFQNITYFCHFRPTMTKISQRGRIVTKFCVERKNRSLRWSCKFQLNLSSPICCTSVAIKIRVTNTMMPEGFFSIPPPSLEKRLLVWNSTFLLDNLGSEWSNMKKIQKKVKKYTGSDTSDWLPKRSFSPPSPFPENRLPV